MKELAAVINHSEAKSDYRIREFWQDLYSPSNDVHKL